MDNNGFNNESLTIGVPYDDINWYDIEGQPFGTAQNFNAIVFNDANNIIDISGAFAVGGNFYSPRGMSLAFGTGSNLMDVGYDPYNVRFLTGGSVTTNGPLVVVGHVVGNGPFYIAKGSTYLIGKSGDPNQLEELTYLYQRNGGSRYWAPSDKGDHYLIPNYDIPRYIPASRIAANVSQFFQDARESITAYKECIEALEVNGTVINNNHELILRGSDPYQNVFLIDVRPNGLLNKGIRAEVPEGSLVIVRLRTGEHAHLQYGLYGERRRANHTLYVFEDARQIHMESPADIWGSILAPDAMFHGHPTGGHVSGNVALRSFAVNPNSGFEFHLFPFVGGVECEGFLPIAPAPVAPAPVAPSPVAPAPVAPAPVAPAPVAPAPVAPSPVAPAPVAPAPVAPAPVAPAPVAPAPIVPAPELVCPPCPTPEPCPVCPPQEPCPVCPPQEPCPVCLPQEPCPACPPQEPCPVCPPQEPCPECYPEVIAYPVFLEPIQMECPECPECPEYPPCPECPPCPPCYIPPCPEYPECDVQSGFIEGCIYDCICCKKHQWEVKLCVCIHGEEHLLYCKKISCGESFCFEVPYKGSYLLAICSPPSNLWSSKCRPSLVFKNVGVERLMVEYR